MNNLKKKIIQINNRLLDLFDKIHNRSKYATKESLGHMMLNYFLFLEKLDERYKLSIPKEIKKIKIDIGLSFCAPNSAIWLENTTDCMVFGFEPNPENIQEIKNGTKRRGFKVLDKELIGKKFLLFDLAIDEGNPSMKKFYMTKKDPGTSGFYEPRSFLVKKIIEVPTIRLSDFLSLIPWDRFEHIEHIKTDTQGNDLRVLKSAGQYLTERVVFVTAETSASKYYSFSHTEEELDRFMKSQNFSILENTSIGGNKTYINNKFKHLRNTISHGVENS